MKTSRQIGLFLGPLLFIAFHFFGSGSLYSCLGVAFWMLTWWVTETLSLFLTALLPIVLFPAIGIFEIGAVTAFYGHKILFLFMGGFIIALAMEKWNVHKRIALKIIQTTGYSATGIILGFMIATGLLSMWISNTATAVMMLPIATSVNELICRSNKENSYLNKFSLALFLCIAYAANIGGIATLIGTPPNVVMASLLEEYLSIELSFAKYMVIGVPTSVIMLVCCYLLLSRSLKNKVQFVDIMPLIREKQKELGPTSVNEKRVLMVFLCTAALWIFRKPIQSILPLPFLDDYYIAMLAGVSLFIIPADGKGRIMDWIDMKNLPWGILMLFGGGLALASGLKETGVINAISEFVLSLNFEEAGVYLLILTAISLFLTEVMSNVALTTVFIPIVIGIASGLHENAVYFVLPATLAASFAFMLPISTPPNTVVFASGQITVSQMMRKGILLNVFGVALLWALGMWVLPLVF